MELNAKSEAVDFKLVVDRVSPMPSILAGMQCRQKSRSTLGVPQLETLAWGSFSSVKWNQTIPCDWLRVLFGFLWLVHVWMCEQNLRKFLFTSQVLII